MKESNIVRNLIKANCSSQQVECSFDNPAEHNFLKVRKLFSQIQKKCKIFILNSLFFLKNCSSGHLKTALKTLPKNIRSKLEYGRLFLQSHKKFGQ